MSKLLVKTVLVIALVSTVSACGTIKNFGKHASKDAAHAAKHANKNAAKAAKKSK